MANLIRNVLSTAASWDNPIGAAAHNLLERMGTTRDDGVSHVGTPSADAVGRGVAWEAKQPVWDAARGTFTDPKTSLSEGQPEGRIEDDNQAPLLLPIRHSAEVRETLNSVMSEAASRLTKEQTALDGISQDDGAAREAQQEKIAALSYMVSEVSRVIDGADHLDLSDHAYYQGNTGSVESAESRHVAFVAEASDLIAKVEAVGVSVDTEFRVTTDPEWEGQIEDDDADLDRQEMEGRDWDEMVEQAEVENMIFDGAELAIGGFDVDGKWHSDRDNDEMEL